MVKKKKRRWRGASCGSGIYSGQLKKPTLHHSKPLHTLKRIVRELKKKKRKEKKKKGASMTVRFVSDKVARDPRLEKPLVSGWQAEMGLSEAERLRNVVGQRCLRYWLERHTQ
jgi:hypothetical protein